MDEFVKTLLTAGLTGLIAVLSGYVTGRQAARREDAQRAFNEKQQSIEYIRERRRYYGDAKLAALKATVVSLAALKGSVDQVMLTGLGREELSRVGNAVTDITEKAADFDLLFPAALQLRRAQAAEALLKLAVLAEKGLTRSDPEYQEAKKASEKEMRDFEILARVELGLEPDLEMPLTRKRHTQTGARA